MKTKILCMVYFQKMYLTKKAKKVRYAPSWYGREYERSDCERHSAIVSRHSHVMCHSRGVSEDLSRSMSPYPSPHTVTWHHCPPTGHMTLRVVTWHGCYLGTVTQACVRGGGTAVCVWAPCHLVIDEISTRFHSNYRDQIPATQGGQNMSRIE